MTSARRRSTHRPGAPRRRLATMATAGLIVVGGVFGAAPAHAQVSPGATGQVWYNLGETADSTATIEYSTFLASLRQAASVTAPDGALQTQDDTRGLISAQLGAQDDAGTWRTVRLWFQPQNLYVLGFQPEHSAQPILFNDAEVVTPIGSAGYHRMGFGGNYDALNQAAGRDRSEMPISHNDIRGAILQLSRERQGHHGVADRQATARSMMLLIQMTSEAARLNDVEGTFRSAVGTWSYREGLPAAQVSLENNWGRISQFFAQAVGGNTANPPTVQGVGTIRNATEARNYVRVMLGTPTGSGHERWHDEL